MEGTIATIPIIGITASAAPNEIDACVKAGMDDCLSKPVEAAKLRAVLEVVGRGDKPFRRTQSILHEKAPSEPAGHDNPPVNLAALSRIIDDDDEAELFSMLRMFCEEFPSQLARLEAAIKQRDSESVRMSAHAAKGAASSGCALVLADMLKEVEGEAHDNNWDLTERRMVAINGEYDRVADFCEKRG